MSSFDPLTNTLSPLFRLCLIPDAIGVCDTGSAFTLLAVCGAGPLFRLELELERDLCTGRGILGVVGRARRLGVDGRREGVSPLKGRDCSDKASSAEFLKGTAPSPGVLDNLEILQNTPRLASHWKYLTPFTDPSFLPIISSSTTPAQSPGANCVSPRNAINPGLEPLTNTRSPIMKSSERGGGPGSSSSPVSNKTNPGYKELCTTERLSLPALVCYFNLNFVTYKCKSTSYHNALHKNMSLYIKLN